MSNEPQKTIDVPVGKEPQDVEHAYIMTFRDAQNPLRIKGFKHRGDLRSARNRAFKHGTIMGYKNVWVMPLFSNLLEEERGAGNDETSTRGENVSPREHQKEIPVVG